MSDLLTPEQMRAVETAAMNRGTVTGLELMERAGRGLVDAVCTHWPDLARGPHRALVLCGPGNNGGDGFVVARLLCRRGWTVDLRLLGDPDRLRGDAAVNHARWLDLGAVTALDDGPGDLSRYDLVVDALFGTGLSRALDGPAATAALALAAAEGVHRVAVDLPSGLCGSSGRPLGPTARADLTVSFHRFKPGHVLAQGPAHCGALALVDIGLADGGDIALLDSPPTGVAKRAGHKFDHGHALVLSGGAGHTGAARLAARGALRIGAGLVTLGVPPAAQFEVAAQVTAIMLARIATPDVLRERLEDSRIRALCLGPGLGLSERKAGLVAAALEGQRPTVLDADALTLIARDRLLFQALHPECVLTPHDGEFARLFPDLAAQLGAPPVGGPAFSRIDATRTAADRAGCTVLLKGPDTVIAAPGGAVAVHSAAYGRAVPWLATAGAGDVLAGLIAGLLSRGRAPFDAACASVWLHVEAARDFGPGLIAEDLADRLPAVLRRIGA